MSVPTTFDGRKRELLTSGGTPSDAGVLAVDHLPNPNRVWLASLWTELESDYRALPR